MPQKSKGHSGLWTRTQWSRLCEQKKKYLKIISLSLSVYFIMSCQYVLGVHFQTNMLNNSMAKRKRGSGQFAQNQI